ncbi:MAG TPA: ABC transporter permease [Candidatus Limnocylindrales bacterium]|jgi:peptide/nickel transport system permease protein|nr:ABC transporter permease [Candidatus Limnocylindrales bacterium]
MTSLDSAATGLAAGRPIVTEGAGRRAVRRFLRHRAALAGLFFIALVAGAAIFGPFVYRGNPDRTNPAIQFTAPNAEHPLGTDRIGRDLLARLLYAGRISLAVGVAAALVATGIGLVLGLIAGIAGGWVDSLIMRVTDVVLAIPFLIFVAIVVAIVGTGFQIIVVVIGLSVWPEAARIVRAVVLSLREQDFVVAARALGATNGRIIRKHLLFFALAPLTVTGTFTVANAMLTEAALSYLGIGVRPPQASWGNMLYDAQQLFILRDHLWYWVPPGIAIFVTVLAVNLVGDGLRDALDPHD